MSDPCACRFDEDDEQVKWCSVHLNLRDRLAAVTRERDEAYGERDNANAAAAGIALRCDALRAEVERLLAALLALANAADTVGVMHFDSDSWPQEVDAMRDATIAARAALQEPTP